MDYHSNVGWMYIYVYAHECVYEIGNLKINFECLSFGVLNIYCDP